MKKKNISDEPKRLHRRRRHRLERQTKSDGFFVPLPGTNERESKLSQAIKFSFGCTFEFFETSFSFSDVSIKFQFLKPKHLKQVLRCI